MLIDVNAPGIGSRRSALRLLDLLVDFILHLLADIVSELGADTITSSSVASIGWLESSVRPGPLGAIRASFRRSIRPSVILDI
jgi:hypothetical protein